MLSIITPCSRQNNIPKLFNSINFDKISKWIIVYDTSKNRTYNTLYKDHSKILEVECNDIGVSGNSQRNYAMKLVEDGYIYFLDDDNIIHPGVWSIVDTLDNENFYTFNQLRDKKGGILHGNNISVGRIDTAMFIVHKKHIGDIKWEPHTYYADGVFISNIHKNNKGLHTYINSVASYYNFIE